MSHPSRRVVQPPSRVGRAAATARTATALALYVAYWTTGVAFVSAALLCVTRGAGDGRMTADAVLGIVFAALIAVMWLPLSFGRENGEGPQRQPLSRERFAKLYELVAELARRVGAAPPERIFLVDEFTAFCWRSRDGLRTVSCISVGLPLFATMSKGQLSAVLAHELAHAARGALPLGGWVYRTRAAVSARLERLGRSAAHLPYRGFGALFLRITAPTCRELEFEADARAAHVCGADDVAHALTTMYSLGVPWDVYFYADLLPWVRGGARLPIIEGFGRFRAEPAPRQEVRAALRDFDPEALSSDPAIPSLPERKAALGATADTELRQVHSCFELLGAPGAVETLWYQLATVGEATPVTWEELGPRILLRHLREDFRESAHPPAMTPLATVADLAPANVFPWPLSKADRAPEPDDQRRARLKRGWVAWMTVALVDRGYSLRIQPGAYYRLERDGRVVEPEPSIDGLLSGDLSPEAFRARVAEWEADRRVLAS